MSTKLAMLNQQMTSCYLSALCAIILTILCTPMTSYGSSDSLAACELLLTADVSAVDVRSTLILGPDDKAQVQQILQASDMSEGDKWILAADIYLEARLQMLPENYRQTLRKKLQAFRPSFVPYNEEILTSKEILLPMAFKDTALPYIVMLHEWEHIIRHQLKGESSLHALNYQFNFLEMYHEETYSISAEWELAQFVTDGEVGKIMDITSRANLGTGFEFFVQSILENRHHSTKQDYIKAVQSTGRYSYLYSLKKTLRNSSAIAAIATVTIAWPAYLCSFVFDWLM